MRDKGQLYFATNREIHDLLYSAKQKVTEAVLHDLLRDRGIFCSPRESRESLVKYLALLSHDYADVCGILEKGESSRRGEKTTTVTLNTALTAEELKEVVEAYQAEELQEEVRSHKKSAHEFAMKVTYAEFDYSKTRLLQRQDRDAEILFTKVGETTQVRVPATERAHSMVEKLKVLIESKKKQPVQMVEIELTGLATPEQRTTFFTKLISTLPDYSLVTVSRLRVAHAPPSFGADDLDLDDEEVNEAEEAMLGVIENVALTGENLIASEMYQELRAKGFFVTSVTWRSKQNAAPYTMIECDAGFGDRQAGRGFRYSIHGSLRFKAGQYAKNIRPVSELERASILAMIEQTARNVLASLLSDADAATRGG